MISDRDILTRRLSPLPDEEYEDGQLTHVRGIVDDDDDRQLHVMSVIAQGHGARVLSISLAACPYGNDDPDGVSWWKLGWMRADLHETKYGRPSLLGGLHVIRPKNR